jgi:hypothetical protein
MTRRIDGHGLARATGRRRTHIPLLEERNTRTGFFELETLRDVIARLPQSLRPVIEFRLHHRLARPV